MKYPGNRRLNALARLLTLRASTFVPAVTGSRVIALLALITLVTWVGIDWLRAQPDPDFYAYNIPDLAWCALLTLGMAAVLAHRSVPALGIQPVLVCLLTVAPVAITAQYLIQFRLERPWMVSTATVGLYLYLFLYTGRSLGGLSGRWQWKALALGALFAVCSIYVTNALFVDPSVWYSQDEEDDDDDAIAPDEAESLLFSQSARIDDDVAHMAPTQAGVPSAFFIGVAGYAQQRVFAEEIKLAQSSIGRRFGSTDRSLLLINDRRARNDEPLASPTALRYALRAVAAKMNLDKDVLFLSLSSHGSHDGSFSISNGSLPLHDLTADDLASFLKESGIEWRVIVVSACYSGTFIGPLLSSGTAVITAAASDRTSFGCADDRDLTYFGEAFYRDALPGARSLGEAFDRAKVAIAAREKVEGVEPSSPQAFFGAGIAKRLEQLKAAARK